MYYGFSRNLGLELKKEGLVSIMKVFVQWSFRVKMPNRDLLD